MCGTLGHHEHWLWWWQWRGSPTPVPGETHQAYTSHGHPTPVDPTASPQSRYTPIFLVMGVQSCPSGGATFIQSTFWVAADVPSLGWHGMQAVVAIPFPQRAQQEFLFGVLSKLSPPLGLELAPAHFKFLSYLTVPPVALTWF